MHFEAKKYLELHGPAAWDAIAAEIDEALAAENDVEALRLGALFLAMERVAQTDAMDGQSGYLVWQDLRI